MDRYLVCPVDIFDLEQKIYLVTNDETKLITKTPVYDITDAIINSCMRYGIENVYLQGLEEYLKELEEEIYKSASVDYNYNNIKVHIV